MATGETDANDAARHVREALAALDALPPDAAAARAEAAIQLGRTHLRGIKNDMDMFGDDFDYAHPAEDAAALRRAWNLYIAAACEVAGSGDSDAAVTVLLGVCRDETEAPGAVTLRQACVEAVWSHFPFDRRLEHLPSDDDALPKELAKAVSTVELAMVAARCGMSDGALGPTSPLPEHGRSDAFVSFARNVVAVSLRTPKRADWPKSSRAQDFAAEVTAHPPCPYSFLVITDPDGPRICDPKEVEQLRPVQDGESNPPVPMYPDAFRGGDAAGEWTPPALKFPLCLVEEGARRLLASSPATLVLEGVRSRIEASMAEAEASAQQAPGTADAEEKKEEEEEETPSPPPQPRRKDVHHVIIVGPVGAGKSAFFNSLLRLPNDQQLRSSGGQLVEGTGQFHTKVCPRSVRVAGSGVLANSNCGRGELEEDPSTTHELAWPDGDEPVLLLTDTPGLSTGFESGADRETMRKRIPYITAFILGAMQSKRPSRANGLPLRACDVPVDAVVWMHSGTGRLEKGRDMPLIRVFREMGVPILMARSRAAVNDEQVWDTEMLTLTEVEMATLQYTYRREYCTNAAANAFFAIGRGIKKSLSWNRRPVDIFDVVYDRDAEESLALLDVYASSLGLPARLGVDDPDSRLKPSTRLISMRAFPEKMADGKIVWTHGTARVVDALAAALSEAEKQNTYVGGAARVNAAIVTAVAGAGASATALPLVDLAGMTACNLASIGVMLRVWNVVDVISKEAVFAELRRLHVILSTVIPGGGAAFGAGFAALEAARAGGPFLPGGLAVAATATAALAAVFAGTTIVFQLCVRETIVKLLADKGNNVTEEQFREALKAEATFMAGAGARRTAEMIKDIREKVKAEKPRHIKRYLDRFRPMLLRGLIGHKVKPVTTGDWARFVQLGHNELAEVVAVYGERGGPARITAAGDDDDEKAGGDDDEKAGGDDDDGAPEQQSLAVLPLELLEEIGQSAARYVLASKVTVTVRGATAGRATVVTEPSAALEVLVERAICKRGEGALFETVHGVEDVGGAALPGRGTLVPVAGTKDELGAAVLNRLRGLGAVLARRATRVGLHMRPMSSPAAALLHPRVMNLLLSESKAHLDATLKNFPDVIGLEREAAATALNEGFYQTMPAVWKELASIEPRAPLRYDELHEILERGPLQGVRRGPSA